MLNQKMETSHDADKQNLLIRLLDAVKQCQIRFGGKSELATETDVRVSILCGAWEGVLQHGLKHSHKALSTIKQVTEITGITKIGSGIGFVDDFRNLETEPTFWTFIREHLSRHDLQRYSLLKVIWTDSGRGRAWLRATLNEHSLEKYMHMLVESGTSGQYYDDWAFMRDHERATMLPSMAAGLGSILFAISIDNDDLNSVQKASGLDSLLSSSAPPNPFLQPQKEEPRPVIASHNNSVAIASDRRRAREKKRKKKVVKIVSFDEDDLSGSSSIASPLSLTSAVDIPSPNESESSVATEEPCTSDASTGGCVGQSSIDKEEKIASLKKSDSVLSADSMVVEDLVPLDSEGQQVHMVTKGHHRVISMDLKSESSLDISDAGSSYSERTLEAQAAIAIAHECLSASHNLLRTEADGSHAPEPVREGMNESELKQALVAMMQHKDSIEENNRMLRNALEQEQRMTQALRTEIQEFRQTSCARQQRDADKLKLVTGENELLKHQLKKYVGAVQMLRRQGAKAQGIHLDALQPPLPEALSKLPLEFGDYEQKIVQVKPASDFPGIHVDDAILPAIPEPPSTIDYCHEASQYEHKLIQVAEMHGELIEFNEVLQRQLVNREQQLRQLRTELVSLRGPLPQEAAEDSWSVISGPEAEESRVLINIWIPSAFLHGVGSDAFHVYQVYVRVRDEEWNVYRRYSEFHDLNIQLKKKHSSVVSFEFPKKKTLGSKDPKFVEDRRQKLQKYLRSVINLILQHNEELSNEVNRTKLQEIVPFFRDPPKEEKKKAKSSRHNASTTQHYNGL